MKSVRVVMQDRVQGSVQREYLHDDVARGGVLPVRRVLHTQDDVVLTLNLGEHESFSFLGCLYECALLWCELSSLGRVQHARRVDHDHVRTVLVLHADVDLAWVEATSRVSF